MPRLGRERILAGGDTGAGKTYAWMSIADALRGQAKFLVLNMDDGTMKVADEYPKIKADEILPSVQALTNDVNVLPVPETWDEFYEQMNCVQRLVKAGKLTDKDWIILEGTDLLGQNLRFEFADRTSAAQVNKGKPVNSKDLADSSWDAFITKRKTGAPILEPSDYDAIYTELRKPIAYLTMQIPCQIFGVSATEAHREGVGSDSNTAKAEREWYASIGMPMRYSGWRVIPKMFDTLILFGGSLASGYQFQVFKDRGGHVRGPQTNERTVPAKVKHENFYQDYLVKVGYNQAKQTVLVPPPPPPPVMP